MPCSLREPPFAQARPNHISWETTKLVGVTMDLSIGAGRAA